jgi:hypothetical protein
MAQSGHFTAEFQCPLWGVKRTLVGDAAMSAFDPKQTLAGSEFYGFPAIEHRFRVLGGDPVIVDDDKKIDLARLLIDIYGVGYAGHPRLEKLLERNHIQPLDFMTGAQEAEAFERRNFVGLHQSTLRKVDIIANILARAQDRNLKTNTTWWEMHGGRLRTFFIWVGENPIFVLIAGAASIIGLVLAVFFAIH